jgi:hypothetical protein
LVAASIVSEVCSNLVSYVQFVYRTRRAWSNKSECMACRGIDELARGKRRKRSQPEKTPALRIQSVSRASLFRCHACVYGVGCVFQPTISLS